MDNFAPTTDPYARPITVRQFRPICNVEPTFQKRLRCLFLTTALDSYSRQLCLNFVIWTPTFRKNTFPIGRFAQDGLFWSQNRALLRLGSRKTDSPVACASFSVPCVFSYHNLAFLSARNEIFSKYEAIYKERLNMQS